MSTLTRYALINSIADIARQDALDAIYARCNALGGTVRPGDTEGEIRMAFLDEILDLLIEMGANDQRRFALVPMTAAALAAYRETEA